ncbi:hypothetical protein FRACYDRAFT_250626 [Fragilariopsis cylindrus CCMP1102]|uniref:Uncharacterized protein n=1 Tax=Fragilariopsis cylindrus CCMP1102 TaxID=635003 RepID=A0A1E7EQ13_9STRA|nr:hypothetical protein FRACYDRAFT_250626 [Fragilariopsis cylindrus CCMP1102]|eukprot:OEU07955.1 hypothetical protein FRACYDRAFT_250626 [Fragilariopsis cylindrus CCMP1102]
MALVAADVVFPLPLPLRWGFRKIRPSEHRIPPEHTSIIDVTTTKTNRNSIDIPPPSDSNSSDGGVKVVKVKGGHWGEYTSRNGTTFLKICGWEDIVNKFSIKMKEFLVLLVTTKQAQTQTQTQKQQKDNDDKTTTSTTLSTSSTSGVLLPTTLDVITGLPFDIDTLGRQCGFWQLIVRHQQQQQKQQQKQQQQQQQQEKHENTNEKKNDNRKKMKNIKLNLQRRSKQCGNRIRLDFIIDSDSDGDGAIVNAKDNANDNVDANANANATSSDSMRINLMRVKVARQNYRNAIITAKKITKELDVFLSL